MDFYCNQGVCANLASFQFRQFRNVSSWVWLLCRFLLNDEAILLAQYCENDIDTINLNSFWPIGVISIELLNSKRKLERNLSSIEGATKKKNYLIWYDYLIWIENCITHEHLFLFFGIPKIDNEPYIWPYLWSQSWPTYWWNYLTHIW